MSNISLNTGGLPQTVLAPEPAEILQPLEHALTLAGDERRSAVAAVLVNYPRSLFGWALLGDLGRDPIESYAAYRVGYHRGLDHLRQSGWRGSGFVRSEHVPNHGFLHALFGLGATAHLIGETDEAQRCGTFIAQLDPDFDPERLVLRVAESGPSS